VLLVGVALGSPLRAAIVSGESMTPTLRPGQFILSYRDGRKDAIRRGDVVLLRYRGQVYVKRVFAVGGDRFWKTSGMGAADTFPSLLPVGQRVEAWRERYPLFRFQQVRVPHDQFYVVGDGQSSIDSRFWGAVPREEVVGRVVFPTIGQPPEDREPAVWTALPVRPRLAARARLTARS
jgi:signal peptidase I